MSNTTVVDNAKDHVWHHLTQHKAFEENDPLVMTEAQLLDCVAIIIATLKEFEN